MLTLSRLVLLAALCGLFSTDAFAGAGTVTGKDASGATHTWDVITDGSGNFVWMNGICDGTAAAQCAAVKAASTAAGATDPAMVVAVSPNNSVAITAASLPLPTGASTSAKQPALGTAGTASTDVITVQGIASMTALAVSASALPLPTGAATSALQTTGNSTLTTINTTLGTPMQNTGGSVTANAGTNLNTSALATSANQTNANQKTQIVDGSGNVIASTSNNLNVQCANCSGSGASAADAATFTAGTSTFAPAGGQFTSGGATACVTGHQCLVGITSARGFLTDTSTVNGVTVLTGTGAVGTGSQRVAVGTDTATIAGSAPGTAGTASTNVVTVQGIASMTALAISAASLPLPTGASTSALQPTNAAIASTTSGQTGHLIMGAVTTGAPTYTTAQTDPLSLDTAGNLRINCVTGCSSSGGSSLADEGTFTQGTTSFTAIGGIFNSAISNLTSGQAGAVQLTNDRNIFVNLNKLAGSALGSPSNYGTSPGAVEVIGVNAFVTNANANGQATMANSSPVAIASNQSAISTNLAQVNAVTILTGAGAVGTGSERVAVGQDTTTIAGSAPGTAGSASANVLTVQGVASMTPILANPGTAASWGITADAGTFTAGTTVSSQIAGQFTSGGATACVTGHSCTVGITAARGLLTDFSSFNGTAVVANPCITGTISYIPISQTASTQLASLGGSSKKNYVCSIAVVGADAENVSLVEGTGTVCATTPAAIIGSTTAANGPNFAANGGLTLGNGAAPVAAGSLTSLNNVCLLQSGGGRVAGTLVLAQQ
jgi:hypothetical protein